MFNGIRSEDQMICSKWRVLIGRLVEGEQDMPGPVFVLDSVFDGSEISRQSDGWEDWIKVIGQKRENRFMGEDVTV